MDAFVEAMRDLSISNYTTTNRIGATEIVQSYAGYGVPQQFEIDKAEVSLDDFTQWSITFYGEQMKLEYEAWKEAGILIRIFPKGISAGHCQYTSLRIRIDSRHTRKQGILVSNRCLSCYRWHNAHLPSRRNSVRCSVRCLRINFSIIRERPSLRTRT